MKNNTYWLEECGSNCKIHVVLVELKINRTFWLNILPSVAKALQRFWLNYFTARNLFWEHKGEYVQKISCKHAHCKVVYRSKENGKQPDRPNLDSSCKKMWYIHLIELYEDHLNDFIS